MWRFVSSMRYFCYLFLFYDYFLIHKPDTYHLFIFACTFLLQGKQIIGCCELCNILLWINYIEFFVCERENALNVKKPIRNRTWAVAINSSSSRNTFRNSQQNTKHLVQEIFYKTFNDRYFFCLKKKIYTFETRFSFSF